MSWIKNSFVIVLISCLGSVLLIECVLNLIKKNDDWEKISEANILRNFEYRYDISKLYEFTDSSVDYIRNEFGLRDNCEKLEDIDILTIGGSTTDQRYVQFQFTYQTVLQEKLRKVDKNFGCVTNAGVDGHSTWGHIFAFKHWFSLIQDLNPRYVLLFVGVNDAGFDRITRPKYIDVYKSSRLSVKSFLKRSEIARRLLPIYRYLRQSNENYAKEYAGHKPNNYKIDDYNISKLNKETMNLSKN